MTPSRVMLMSCGSFNPPTNMHLRMFEIARDHLNKSGMYIVVGGVISPVHDNYAHKELVRATHRCAMLQLALRSTDWIRLSPWESQQNDWTKTRISLQYHQNMLNSVIMEPQELKQQQNNDETESTDWIPESLKNSLDASPVQIKLLCGGDFIESFGIPGVWREEDIDAIVSQHGIVVVTREGCNPNKFIYDNDILYKNVRNIQIVTEWIPNEVSSTRIRRALKRGESVRYLIQDLVLEYIHKHGIYEAKTTAALFKLTFPRKNLNTFLSIESKYEGFASLTPSPNDVSMGTPSPTDLSIDVADSVRERNLQNTAATSAYGKLSSIDEIDCCKTTAALTAYPGLAKQICVAKEIGEAQILDTDEVGSRDYVAKRVAKVETGDGKDSVDSEDTRALGYEGIAYIDENVPDDEFVARSNPVYPEIDGKYIKSVVNARKSPKRKPRGGVSLVEFTEEHQQQLLSKNETRRLKGSLDSVIGFNGSDLACKRRNYYVDLLLTNRSKSYESIKRNLVPFVASDADDEGIDTFCTACANESRSDPNSLNKDTYYALRSTCSSPNSPIDDNFTDCEICSSEALLNNQSITDELVCEICAREEAANLLDEEPSLPEDDATPVSHRSTVTFRMDDERFEIDNCGSADETSGIEMERTETRAIKSSLFVPKDEVEILSSGVRKINRHGSLIHRRDTRSEEREKRRFSSVDNLQHAKSFTLFSDSGGKYVKSRSAKSIIGSADNIRNSRHRRSSSLRRRSETSLRYPGSSLDDLDSLQEGLASCEDEGDDESKDKVKMILTKDGIKVISEKEAVL